MDLRPLKFKEHKLRHEHKYQPACKDKGVDRLNLRGSVGNRNTALVMDIRKKMNIKIIRVFSTMT